MGQRSLLLLNTIVLFFMFFIFIFDWTCEILKFPGQGSNTHHSSHLSHSSDNVESLTYQVTREIHFISWLAEFICLRVFDCGWYHILDSPSLGAAQTLLHCLLAWMDNHSVEIAGGPSFPPCLAAFSAWMLVALFLPQDVSWCLSVALFFFSYIWKNF